MRRSQLIAINLVWLAGCGRDSAPSSSNSTDHAAGTPAATGAGSKRKPCEYMARADAETAVGQPLPNTTENAPLGMCDYNTAEFYGASLTVGEWESMKNAANSKPDHPAAAVAGIGDEALHLSELLYVRKGDRGFLVHINGPKVDGLPDHGLERTKALALKIVPNL